MENNSFIIIEQGCDNIGHEIVKAFCNNELKVVRTCRYYTAKIA